MRLNEHTKLISSDSRVVLVPYGKEHVPKYNDWMKDPQLQEMTGSEPLTLDEEYEMQQRWKEDDDKLTFILHFFEDGSGHLVSDDELMRGHRMVGDVNAFVCKNGGNSKDTPLAEIDVSFRKKKIVILLSFFKS
jgi:RimJ/RimL family protein N-acetyltransferase